MANSRFYQFHYSKTPMLTSIAGAATFGASGAVASIEGVGVLSVTQLTTGVYRVKLVDNFNAFVSANTVMEAGVTGSPVNDGSLVTNTVYQITTVGTTNWAGVGLPAGLTPAVGQVFCATGAGGAGSGTATAIGPSNILKVEFARSNSAELAPSILSPGAMLTLLTYDKTEALANPASGSKLRFEIMLRNSSNAY